MRKLAAALVLVLLHSLALSAATKVAIADGNFTTAATWGTADATSQLIANSTSTTALTTSDQFSATWTPGAITVDRFAVRLASRATGTPSNTMTIHLQTGAGVDAISCTINVSELPVANTTDDNGGWIICKNSGGGVTLAAATTYRIAAKLSATTTAVSLSTNGTAANWQRMVVTTTTGAPAAADDLHVAGMWTNSASPAVKSTRSVTMDNTTTTNFGSNQTASYRLGSGVSISTGGTLAYTTAASTTSILQLQGFVECYSGGEFDQGKSGSAIPRGSKARLLLNSAADNQFGVEIRNGCTRNLEGSSNLSANNTTYVFLTADITAGATSASTSATLSAANGDTIVIAGTGIGSSNRNKNDAVTLSADASGSSLSFGATTNAHTGTNHRQAEVIDLTRNVTVEAVTPATLMTFEYWYTGSTTTARWAEWNGIGQGTTIGGLRINNTGAVVQYCSLHRSDGDLLMLGSTSLVSAVASASVTNTVFYDASGATSGSPAVIVPTQVGTATGLTFSDNVLISTAGAGVGGFWLKDLAAMTAASNLYVADTAVSSFGGPNILLGDCNYDQGEGDGNGLVLTNITTHSGGVSQGISVCNTSHVTLASPHAWGISSGLYLESSKFITITSATLHDAATANVNLGSLATAGQAALDQVHFIGGVNASAGSGAYGVMAAGGAWTTNTIFDGVAFGSTAGGSYSSNTAGDFGLTNATNNYNHYDILWRGCTFDQSTSSTWHNAFSTVGAVLRWQSSTDKFVDIKGIGTIKRETSTVDVSPSVKLTPASAALKLDTSANGLARGFLVPVSNGQAPTVSIKVQKDGSYNGNSPRIIEKANAALGVTSDTVVATCSASSGSWTTCSGTVSAVTDDGVLEFVVDVDGTAGNMFVDTFAVTGADGSGVDGLAHWAFGLPFVELKRGPLVGSGPGVLP